MNLLRQKTRIICVITALFITVCSCSDFSSKEKKPKEATPVDTLSVLDHIKERGKLTAVTTCAPINYNMHNGTPSGFHYELLSSLCSDLDISLDLKVCDNLDSCFNMLEDGTVDIIASNIGTTADNKARFLMSAPVLMERSVLVQRMPRTWHSMQTRDEIENQLIRSTVDFGGKEIHIPKNSYLALQLHNIANEIGDTITIIENDTVNTLDLIQMVANSTIDFTIAEESVAKIAAKSGNDIDITMPVSFERPTGWAMYNCDGDSSLVNAVNTWLDDYQQHRMKRTYNKYFKNSNILATNSDNKSDHISPYDKTIRKVCKNTEWDWRLLASIIYQESRFKPDLTSTKGAYGLMQLMPVVMEKYGIDSTSSCEEQVRAGVKLLTDIRKKLPETITDSTEIIKFTLAAYNCGMGHLLDARRLAEKYDKDPNVWTNNVDYYILNKSKYYKDTLCRNGYLRGTETYNFVEDVLERHKHYIALIKD